MEAIARAKKVVRLFLPPILLRLITSILRLVASPGLEYAPRGWKTELGNDQNPGWNSDSATAVEEERYQRFCETLKDSRPLAFMHEHTDPTELVEEFHNRNITLAYVLALTAVGTTRISVLDYGGSLGHNYSFCKAVFGDREIHIDFNCKEVPKLADIGKRLAPQINWYTDDSCLKKSYDLVIINGVLQYIQKWEDFLERVSPAVNKYLFLGHLPLVDGGPGFVAIQRRYGAIMLHEQFNPGRIVDVVGKTGLRMTREFLTGVRPYIKNAPQPCELRSYLFRRDRDNG